MSGNRIVAIIIVALIHIGLGYALITGLALDVAKSVVERVTTIDVEEPPPPEPEDEPPPPEDIPETAPPPPVAPPPPINIATTPPPIRTQTTIPPPAPPAVRIPPPAPPAPPAPPPVNKSREATPKGLSGWAARIQRNYPRRAERDGIEGNVTVRVTVGPDGRVSACSVSASSGNADLDAAACDGMSRYARYDPALDQNGNPIPDSDVRTISYRLN
ncbi:energy transducer TonB [Qipengyuania gaetbuli]|nr:energy transducer TonB [Qipengyuania gaetbuli]